MKNKIKLRLDKYLGFDSNLLFECGDAIIFGGAIRDSIADMDIQDIDILCGPKTLYKLDELLRHLGYIHHHEFAKIDLTKLYSNLHVINEPQTYIKGRQKIDIIRPSISSAIKNNKEYLDNIYHLIRNVDLSCCAVSYDGKTVSESYKNAIIHCEAKIFREVPNALMNNTRLTSREYKLMERGWQFIKSDNEEIAILREYKLKKFFNGQTIEY